MKSTIRRLGLVCLVFLLSQMSALSVTPIAEGMDIYGHLAYLDFFTAQRRAPRPGELSMADWIVTLRQDMPGPDLSESGERYRRWAGLSADDKRLIAARRPAISDPDVYIQANNQSQHPPLYYALLSPLYRVMKPNLEVGTQLFILGLASACIAALALPGLYLTLRRHFDKSASLIALLALAWFPNFLPFLGRITNDALAFPLVVWSVYLCLRCRDSESRAPLLAAGATIAIAGFAKTYALTLWPLYVACAFFGVYGRRWRMAGLAIAISAVGVGALVGYNLATTGHAILLREMVANEAIPLSDVIMSLIRLNLVWFFGGVAKGFWWFGYQSFVSPGLLFYAPLGLAPILLLFQRRASWPGILREVWPHLLAIVSFVGGMAWHAANFTLLARLRGQAAFSGNEGWYADVLVGSFAVVALVLLKARLSARAFRPTIAAIAIFMVCWNVWARTALAAFWTGQVGTGRVAEEGILRGILWSQAIPALLSPDALGHWLSLPGVIGPIPVLAVVSLLIAIGTTLALLRTVSIPETRT